MSATNGNVKTIPSAAVARAGNETAHYVEAERLIVAAEAAYRGDHDVETATLFASFAQVHATLSMAADHDRLAGCVPEGGSALDVSVRR